MDADPHDMYDYNKKCNEILVRNNTENLIPICKQYKRFLDKCLAWSGPNYQYDFSLLLSYWLYKKLINIYGESNAEEISIGFAALQDTWSHFNYNKIKDPYYIKCKPETNMVIHEDWKNRKKLYEYYVNYDTLFSTVQQYSQKCTEYYDYFKEMNSVYKNFAGLCSPRKNTCPEYFYKFQEKNPDNNIENLPCYKQIDMQKTAAARARLSREGGTSDHSPGPEVGHLKVRGASGPQGDSASTQDTQSTSQSSNIGTKVSHSVLGAAPVLLTATMLYRYTPLGPWIRRFRGGRTNSMNAMDTLSAYTQETGDMFPNDSENYISYQPI